MPLDDKYEEIEERFDGLKELISLGKERGYLLYDEVNDALPDNITSSNDLDNIFFLFGDAGIEVIDSEEALQMVKEEVIPKASQANDSGSDSNTEALEKTNDPVRMYLR